MGTTAVARNNQDQRTEILTTITERYSDEIASLAPRGVAPAHYVAALRLHLAQNPKLLNCSPVSIAQGVLRVAQTGLELGVSCDLLPFGNVCQFNPRYNGIIELALSAGVRAINASVVRVGDDFDYEKGTRYFLRHKHTAKHGEAITHAYALAELKPGSFVFDVLSRDEVDEVRKEFSKSWWWRDSKNKALGTIPLDEIPWYAKKTVLRKLAPYLPKNARLAAALMFADETEQVVPAGEFEVIGTPQAESGIPEGKTAAPTGDDGYQDDSDIVEIDAKREKELLGAKA